MDVCTYSEKYGNYAEYEKQIINSKKLKQKNIYLYVYAYMYAYIYLHMELNGLNKK